MWSCGNKQADVNRWNNMEETGGEVPDVLILDFRGTCNNFQLLYDYKPLGVTKRNNTKDLEYFKLNLNINLFNIYILKL